MAKVAITEQYLEDIADAIRLKTGLTTATYKPSQMAAAIQTITGGGGIIPTGTIDITSNNTYDVTQYAYAAVAVPTGTTINNQDKTVTPTESTQTIEADSGYTGLGEVTINAISSSYVGSGISQRTSTDLTASGATVTVPAGYYGTQATKAVTTTTHPAPSASINTSTGVVTASHTQTEGYVSAGTTTGTLALSTVNGATITPTTSSQVAVAANKYTLGAVNVGAIPSQYIVPTGNKSIIANGTNIDVASYATVSVAVPTGSTINNQDKTVAPSETEQTITYDSGYTGLGEVTVEAISSTYVGSGITQRSSTDLTASGATVTVPAGYYSAQATKSVSSLTLPTATSSSISSGYTKKAIIGRSTSTKYLNIDTGYNNAGGYYEISAVPDGTAGTPTATKGAVSSNSITVTPSVTNTTGYIIGSTINGTAVTVSASELVSGNKPIIANGTNIDVTNYATVSVAVPTGTVNNQDKSVSPTESEQEVTYDSGYTGLGTVTVGAISSTYIGSGITQRSSTDLSASGATVTVPSGYYSTDATKSVSSMTLPTAAAASATSGYTSKATISRSTSDQYINIPTGYNSAGAYYKVSAVANGTVTAPASISGTSATLTTGTGTLTLTKTVSVTPSVTTAGYISSGTAGDSSVSLTASVTIDPTPTASGATVTIPAGYYSAQTTKSVTTMTLPTATSSSATSGYTSKATISRSTADQYINIAPGYNSAGGYYKISAVANGSATGPSSLSGSSATVTTGTNTITLTKTGVSTTPTVSAGYVSSATSSTATVALTASVTTKAAATITPGTTNQTIASGTYLTGTQTISGDANLVASNILSGVSIFGVSGSVVLQTVYVGSSAPSSSLGSNGDIYIQS